MRLVLQVIAAAIILSIVSSSQAFAAKRLPLYEGLLPSGFEMHESQAPFRPDGARVAVVTSANYEAYIAYWKKYYVTQGGRNGFGVDISTIGPASDPRRFIDQVVATLKPRFGDVRPASDLRSAVDGGADYILVVDFFNDGNGWDKYRTWAGVHLLDAHLDHVFSIETHGETKMDSGGLFCLGECQMQKQAESVARGMSLSTSPLLEQLSAKLAATLDR